MWAARNVAPAVGRLDEVSPVPKATNMKVVFCNLRSSPTATYSQLSHIHQAAAQLRNIDSLQQYQLYLSTHQVAIEYEPVIASYIIRASSLLDVCLNVFRRVAAIGSEIL